MSARKLTASLRRKPDAQGAKPVDTGELDQARRQAATQKAEAEKAAREVERLKAEAEKAARERDAVRVESALTSAASKARALNPAQVAQLLGNRVKVAEGKLAVDGFEGDVDAFVTKWLADEGKHFLPPAVGAGGSGAPGTPRPAPQPVKHDLTKAEGLTAYARDREASATRLVGGVPMAMPAAPAPRTAQ